jgi:two-component system phosphate regulon sensor histidine kinase PhoR
VTSRATGEPATAVRDPTGGAARDLSAFAHHLRTPLTGIRGHVELLLGGHCGPLTPVQARSLAAVSFLSHRLESLVEDVVLLAENQLDGLTLVLQTVPVTTLVERVHRSMHGLATATGVPLTLDVPADAGTVLGDPRHLQRAVVNVVSNAIKFSPARTPVVLRASRLGNLSRIAVHDHGIGVPDEELFRIFDREFCAHNAVSEGLAGAGLGLTVAKTIIDRHDGTISALADDSGTTITMTLPDLPGL